MEASPTWKRAAELGRERMALGADGVDGWWEVAGTEGHCGEHGDGGEQRWWCSTPAHGLEQGGGGSGLEAPHGGGKEGLGGTVPPGRKRRGAGSDAASSGGSQSATTRARWPRAGGRGYSKQRRWGTDVWALVQYQHGLNQFNDFKQIRKKFEFVETCFGSKRIFPTSKNLK
jgi:hypothetical protein